MNPTKTSSIHTPTAAPATWLNLGLPSRRTDRPRHRMSGASIIVAGLTSLRMALAPLILLLAAWHAPGWSLLICLTTGFLSDIFDGVLARWFGVATAGLRRFDSMADRIFYLAAVGATCLSAPEVILANATGLGILVFLSFTRHAVDFLKFRRAASYHMWSAKVWGITLFAAFAALWGWGTSVLLPVTIVVGIAAYLEGLVASLLLSRWAHDVPSVAHAWRLARIQRAGSE